MRRFSLSQKALLAVLLIFLPVSAIFLYTYNKTKAHIKEDILRGLEAIAEGYEGQVYQFLEMAKRRASDFASDGFIKDRLEEIIHGRMAAASGLNKHLTENKITLDKTIHSIHIITLDGVVAASTDGQTIGKDISGEEFFRKGKENLTVTESRIEEVGVPVLVVSAPILSGRNAGNTIGVVANIILFSELNKLMTGEFKQETGSTLTDKKRPGSLDVYIVNKERLKISGSRTNGQDIFRQAVDTLPVRKCLNSMVQTSGFYNNSLGTEVAGASACLPSMKWTLIVEIAKDDALAASRVILDGAITTLVIALGLIVVIFIVFLRVIITPLGKLASAAKEITGGNYDVNIPVKTSDEIGTLSDAFNTMAQDIKKGTLALKESGERLKKAQQIARIGSWEWDIEKNLFYYSDEIYKIYGISPEELGATCEDFLRPVQPDDVALVKKAMDDSLGSGRPFSIDYRIRTPDGSGRIIHAQGEVTRGGTVKISGTAQDITERKNAEQALLNKTEELNLLNMELHDLTMRITLVEERERKRFAEILHEGIGQNLVAIKLVIKNCIIKGCKDADEKMRSSISQVLSLIDDTIQTSRTMTTDLYAAPMKNKGLSNAVEWYAESILRPDGIKVSVDIENALGALTDEVQQVIFSIIRECLQNITKYASASNVRVTCAEAGGLMRLSINDNGAGFSYEEVKAKPGHGFGLILMREWAKSINGNLAVVSQPGRGTEVSVEFPVSKR